jgi:hypothetical protein
MTKPGITLSRKPLSEYFFMNHILSALFVVAAVILGAHILTLILSYQGLQGSQTLGQYFGGGLSGWYLAVIFTLTAIVCYNASFASMTVRDQRTWAISALAMLFLSAAQELNTGAYASLVTAHPYFLQQPVWFAIITIAPAVWLTLRLRAALQDSHDAQRVLTLGVLLFLGGMAGRSLLMYYFHSTVSLFWALEVVLHSAMFMLGSIAILAGVLLHERFLYQQIKRMTGYKRMPQGLPETQTETAAWAMEMIGTPSAGKPLTESEKEALAAPRRRASDKR